MAPSSMRGYEEDGEHAMVGMCGSGSSARQKRDFPPPAVALCRAAEAVLRLRTLPRFKLHDPVSSALEPIDLLPNTQRHRT